MDTNKISDVDPEYRIFGQENSNLMKLTIGKRLKPLVGISAWWV